MSKVNNKADVCRNCIVLYRCWTHASSPNFGMPAEKNCSALSMKLLGNLQYNITVEVSEASRFCFRAISSLALIVLPSLWFLILPFLMLFPKLPAFPKQTLVLLALYRLDLRELSAWGFLNSGPSWLFSLELSFMELSTFKLDWREGKTFLHELNKESCISILISCWTTPLFCSHP